MTSSGSAEAGCPAAFRLPRQIRSSPSRSFTVPVQRRPLPMLCMPCNRAARLSPRSTRPGCGGKGVCEVYA